MTHERDREPSLNSLGNYARPVLVHETTGMGLRAVAAMLTVPPQNQV